MTPIGTLERASLLTALLLAGAVSSAGAAFAQYPQSQSQPTGSPPASSTKELMAAKPIIPSKAEMPDAAFKKLDPTGKGYVTTADTKELNGFDKAFQVADANHDGKLDAAEFKKAWATYTGRKSG